MKQFEEIMRIIGDFFVRMFMAVADLDGEQVTAMLFSLAGILFIPVLAFQMATCEGSPSETRMKERYETCYNANIKASECYYQVYGKRDIDDKKKSSNN